MNTRTTHLSPPKSHLSPSLLSFPTAAAASAVGLSPTTNPRYFAVAAEVDRRRVATNVTPSVTLHRPWASGCNSPTHHCPTGVADDVLHSPSRDGSGVTTFAVGTAAHSCRLSRGTFSEESDQAFLKEDWPPPPDGVAGGGTAADGRFIGIANAKAFHIRSHSTLPGGHRHPSDSPTAGLPMPEETESYLKHLTQSLGMEGGRVMTYAAHATTTASPTRTVPSSVANLYESAAALAKNSSSPSGSLPPRPVAPVSSHMGSSGETIDEYDHRCTGCHPDAGGVAVFYTPRKGPAQAPVSADEGSCPPYELPLFSPLGLDDHLPEDLLLPPLTVAASPPRLTTAARVGEVPLQPNSTTPLCSPTCTPIQVPGASRSVTSNSAAVVHMCPPQIATHHRQHSQSNSSACSPLLLPRPLSLRATAANCTPALVPLPVSSATHHDANSSINTTALCTPVRHHENELIPAGGATGFGHATSTTNSTMASPVLQRGAGCPVGGGGLTRLGALVGAEEGGMPAGSTAAPRAKEFHLLRKLTATNMISRENRHLLHWGCFGLLVALGEDVYLREEDKGSVECVHRGHGASVSCVTSTMELESDSETAYIVVGMTTGSVAVYAFRRYIPQLMNDGGNGVVEAIPLVSNPSVRMHRFRVLNLPCSALCITAMQIVDNTLYIGSMEGLLSVYDLPPAPGPLLLESLHGPMCGGDQFLSGEGNQFTDERTATLVNGRGGGSPGLVPSPRLPLRPVLLVDVGQPIFHLAVTEDKNHIAVGTHERLMVYHGGQLRYHAAPSCTGITKPEPLIIVEQAGRPMRAFAWLHRPGNSSFHLYSSPLSRQSHFLSAASTAGLTSVDSAIADLSTASCPPVHGIRGAILVYAGGQEGTEICLYNLGTDKTEKRHPLPRPIHTILCRRHSCELVVSCAVSDGVLDTSDGFSSYRVEVPEYDREAALANTGYGATRSGWSPASGAPQPPFISLSGGRAFPQPTAEGDGVDGAAPLLTVWDAFGEGRRGVDGGALPQEPSLVADEDRFNASHSAEDDFVFAETPSPVQMVSHSRFSTPALPASSAMRPQLAPAVGYGGPSRLFSPGISLVSPAAAAMRRQVATPRPAMGSTTATATMTGVPRHATQTASLLHYAVTEEGWGLRLRLVGHGDGGGGEAVYSCLSPDDAVYAVTGPMAVVQLWKPPRRMNYSADGGADSAGKCKNTDCSSGCRRNPDTAGHLCSTVAFRAFDRLR